jgi:hypothetical protein
LREKGVKRKGPKKYKRKKTGERIEKRKQGTTGEKYYRRGVFLGETEERKGSQQRSGEEREMTEEEIKKNTRAEEQPQLPPCFLSTATAHHLTAADTATFNHH